MKSRSIALLLIVAWCSLASGCDWLFPPREATINFHANAADASGTMDARVVALEASIDLPPCLFSRPGYAFAGWSLSPSASIAFGDEAQVVVGGDLDLYARWSRENAFIDVFDSLSASWHVKSGGWAASGGALTNASGGDGLVWLDAGPTGWFDASVQVNLAAAGSSTDDSIAMWFCANDPASEDIDGSGYAIALSRNGSARVFRVDAGSGEWLLVESSTFAGWNPVAKTLRVRRKGSTINVSIDAVEIASFSSEEWDSGYLAFRAVRLNGTTLETNDSAWALDDFSLVWYSLPE